MQGHYGARITAVVDWLQVIVLQETLVKQVLAGHIPRTWLLLPVLLWGPGQLCIPHDSTPSFSLDAGAPLMTELQPMPDLATHFDDPFLSDFQLRLITPEGVALAQFHVHGIVLAGQSGYFKSLLQNWMGRDARVFSITISEDELPAAKHMLQCAYSNSMPKDATAQQLLATMVLADR